jgi:hypothetical protein
VDLWLSSFWKNPWVIGIVSGVIATILAKLLDPSHPFWKNRWVWTFVGVFAGLIIGIAVQGTASPAPHASPNNSSPVVSSSSPTTAISPRPTGRTLTSPVRPAVWYQGTITITDPGIQLDASPPVGGQVNCTIFELIGYVHPCGNELMAAWRGSSAPTPAQCRDWAMSHAVAQLLLTSGTQLCVITDQQRPAYVKITSVSSDGSTAEAKVTVWNS